MNSTLINMDQTIEEYAMNDLRAFDNYISNRRMSVRDDKMSGKERLSKSMQEFKYYMNLLEDAKNDMLNNPDLAEAIGMSTGIEAYNKKFKSKEKKESFFNIFRQKKLVQDLNEKRIKTGYLYRVDQLAKSVKELPEFNIEEEAKIDLEAIKIVNNLIEYIEKSDKIKEVKEDDKVVLESKKSVKVRELDIEMMMKSRIYSVFGRGNVKKYSEFKADFKAKLIARQENQESNMRTR